MDKRTKIARCEGCGWEGPECAACPDCDGTEFDIIDEIVLNPDAKCQCDSQIVFHFNEKNYIYACTECEITVHYTAEHCPRCGGKISTFALEI
jgi:predicted RNA-binding Zn-ribbon protein involved in translation (DUF1610 family)